MPYWCSSDEEFYNSHTNPYIYHNRVAVWAWVTCGQAYYVLLTRVTGIWLILKKKKSSLLLHKMSLSGAPSHQGVISSNSEFLEEELTMTSLKQFFQDTPAELENVHAQNSTLGAFLTLCDLH